MDDITIEENLDDQRQDQGSRASARGSHMPVDEVDRVSAGHTSNHGSHQASTDDNEEYDTEEEELDDDPLGHEDDRLTQRITGRARTSVARHTDAKPDPPTRRSARIALRSKPVTNPNVHRRQTTSARHPGKKAQAPRHVYANVNVQTATVDKAIHSRTLPQDSQNRNLSNSINAEMLTALSWINTELQKLHEQRSQDHQLVEQLQSQVLSMSATAAQPEQQDDYGHLKSRRHRIKPLSTSETRSTDSESDCLLNGQGRHMQVKSNRQRQISMERRSGLSAVRQSTITRHQAWSDEAASAQRPLADRDATVCMVQRCH